MKKIVGIVESKIDWQHNMYKPIAQKLICKVRLFYIKDLIFLGVTVKGQDIFYSKNPLR